jgi:hypothetical protein
VVGNLRCAECDDSLLMMSGALYKKFTELADFKTTGFTDVFLVFLVSFCSCASSRVAQHHTTWDILTCLDLT